MIFCRLESDTMILMFGIQTASAIAVKGHSRNIIHSLCKKCRYYIRAKTCTPG